MKRLIFLALLLLPGVAGAGSIFDSEYIKYPQEVYEKYCDHYLTAGGCWNCLDAMDAHGIPKMGCSDPTYKWSKREDVERMLSNGWRRSPLNFYESVGNAEYWPGVYWFYKCPE